MIIIGCDYHPGFQQIGFVDSDTGEFGETRLPHGGQAEKFYRELAMRGVQIRVGMEASGQARWFERVLAELKLELWIGDAAEIRAKRVRKKKTDREDARHILHLLVKDRFPRIWGSKLGESRGATVAVAPAPHGADAHPDHEPITSPGSERRTALQEEVMGRARTAATGVLPAGNLGEPSSA